MPEVISRLQRKLLEFWGNLDKSQKTRIYIISAILVVAIAAGIILLTRPNYVPLIRNADPKDIGEMAKILDNQKIKYSLRDNGSSIYINAKDNNKAQVLLFQNGYPKSGMSFEDAFKMIQINTTESDKKKLWENYKKTTLIAKLKMFDNVADADVDLALPEQSMFIGDANNDKRPTAYVRITPKGELTQEQVKGIVMVVSRSVENLNPKDVTVVDNNLNVLNSDSEDDGVTAANTQEKLRIQKKKELEKNVYDMFNGQFDNFDSIRVVANPVLDFNKLKSVTQGVARPEGYQDGGALISSRKITEDLQNGQMNGQPGINSNPGTTGTPSYPTVTQGNSTYKKTDVTENYDYTRSTTEAEKALGDLVPDKSTMTVTLCYGKRVTDEAKLSQAFLDQFKEDVSKATGIPVANIAVNKYKLAPAEAVNIPLSDRIKNLINDYGFFALILLLIVGLMLAMLPRRKPAAVTEQIPVQEVAAVEEAGPRFIVPEKEEELPEIDLEEKSEVKKQIDKFVRQKPEAVAQLLRNWLSDEWD
ncbi:MAG: flagellar basal-body MS-ring/collar protein FliF [Clostridiales bacterium]|jgi:flagellar M-ring protein FliF|nr:flagellar M-ring protein FliF [Eubacteriales bacterium]MDH7564997.1 flagellar basal-body MS-ring/collar protein FliF [Clostridiales bacterium]